MSHRPARNDRHLEASAALLAEFHPDAERETRESRVCADDGHRHDLVCHHCGSGLKRGPRCPVCGRDPSSPVEEDVVLQRAEALVARLVDAGDVLLVNERGRSSLGDRVAVALDSGEGAPGVARVLLDAPEVDELYADDSVLAERIREVHGAH